MGAKINCSICGKPADAAMENCPHCGSPVKVGRAVPPMTPAASSGPVGDACPSCGAPVQDGDIVCVRCGVNLLTGHQVVKKQEAVAAAPSGSSSNTRLLVFSLVAVVVLIVASVAAFMLLRDPASQARKLARSGDLLGAVNVLQKHTGAHPNDVEAFALLGRLYMQSQQFSDAVTAFDTAARLKPADTELGYMVVLAAGKTGGQAGTERQIAALQRILEQKPGDERALRMLALLQGAAGAAGDSTQALDRLASAGGSATEVAKFKGIVEAIAGNFESARASLAGAVAADPDVRLAEGYVAALEGKSANASDALNAVVSTATNTDGEARTRLGLLYMAQGDFDQALPLLRPADQGRPSDNSARFFYALCLQTAGLEDESLLEFERLVSSEGKFAEEAAVQMAMIYLKRDQVDRAAESTRKAQKYGSSARLFTIQGQIAALQGDQAAAQDAFRKAIQADGTYPAAHLENGLMYIQRGVLSEGVRELKRYLELAEPGIPGGRINEVDLLLKQLEQAVDKEGGTS